MEEKHCSNCRNYMALANQGYWWCNAGHTKNMNPKTCGDHDCITSETMTSSISTTFVCENINYYFIIIQHIKTI